MARDIFIEAEKCTGCRLCELACMIYHYTTQKRVVTDKNAPPPLSRITVDFVAEQAFPSLCHHCENPPCVDACITSAMHIVEYKNLVSVDMEKCVGCWMCIMVCPFAAVIQDNQHKKAVKCDKCLGEEVPWCVSWCPTKAIYCGETEDFVRVRISNRVVIPTGSSNRVSDVSKNGTLWSRK